MTIEKVRKLLAIAREKSMIYIKSEGATCPVCEFLGEKFFRVPSYKTVDEVRYHKCDKCGCNFKSVEDKQDSLAAQAQNRAGKIPDYGDKSANIPQNKSRKRRK